MNNIPHNSPNISHTAQSAYDVIKSGNVSAGEKTLELERLWMHTTSSQAAAATSSGTSALTLALQALNVGEGDEVVISAYQCNSAVNAILSIGAVPVLADIWLDSLTINPASVNSKITDKTKAIIATHLFGTKSDIGDLAFGLPVIEDFSHGIFLQVGVLGISSFGPTKLIGSCGGGIVSGSAELIAKVKDLRTGEDKSPSTKLNDLPNDVMSVIALEQLKRLDEIKRIRLGLALRYDALLLELEKVFRRSWQFREASLDSQYYRYTIKLKNHLAPDIVQAMQDRGIQCEMPVFYYRRNWSDLPNTAEAFRTIVSLPFHENITPEEQNKVVQTLAEVLK